jgi:hypothetical protein
MSEFSTSEAGRDERQMKTKSLCVPTSNHLVSAIPGLARAGLPSLLASGEAQPRAPCFLPRMKLSKHYASDARDAEVVRLLIRPLNSRG